MVRKDKPLLIFVAIAIYCLAVTVTTAQIGKAGDAFGGSKDLRKRTSNASAAVDKYLRQLRKTQRALESMGAANSDAEKRYKSLSREIDKLDRAQKHAISDIDKMRSTANRYFSLWQKTNDQIADNELRYAGAEQRSHVMRQYDELAIEQNKVGLELQPFSRKLGDLKDFLGEDLSRTSVEKASEMIRVSQEAARILEDKIRAAQERIKSIQTSAQR